MKNEIKNKIVKKISHKGIDLIEEILGEVIENKEVKTIVGHVFDGVREIVDERTRPELIHTTSEKEVGKLVEVKDVPVSGMKQETRTL